MGKPVGKAEKGVRKHYYIIPWTNELWEYEPYKSGIKSGKMDVIFGERKWYKTLIRSTNKYFL